MILMLMTQKKSHATCGLGAKLKAKLYRFQAMALITGVQVVLTDSLGAANLRQPQISLFDLVDFTVSKCHNDSVS